MNIIYPELPSMASFIGSARLFLRIVKYKHPNTSNPNESLALASIYQKAETQGQQEVDSQSRSIRNQQSGQIIHELDIICWLPLYNQVQAPI